MTSSVLPLHTRAVILGVWSAAVLPFVHLGFGSDGDAWLVARAADAMRETGRYVASRSTGFPLYELAVTPLVSTGGWVLSNLFSFVAGIAVVLALFRLARDGQFRSPLSTILSLAFLPAMIKNAASTMDYIPGLALLLWAYVMLIEERAVFSALLIGISCGMRPTNGLLLVPALVMLIVRGRVRDVPKVAATAIAAGILVFAPALLTVPLRSSYALGATSAGMRLLAGGYNLLQVFGVPASLAIAGVLTWNGFTRNRNHGEELPHAFFLFHTLTIALWFLLFLLLPDEPEYLLPAVPSVLFLVDRMASHRVMAVICILILSFHVVKIETVGGESGKRKPALSCAPGYTIADAEDRVFKLSVRQAMHRFMPSQPTVLLYGALWIPTHDSSWNFDARLNMYRRRGSDVYVSGIILDPATLKTLHDHGYRLVLWTNDKAEYAYSDNREWTKYIDVTSDLNALLGARLRGKPLTVH